MDVDDFLEHHGVRGMKWGVRKSRESSGENQSSKKPDSKKDLSPLEHQVLDAAAKQGMTPDRMNRLYGPESKKQSKSIKLTSTQKQVLKKAAIAGGVGLALYGLNKFGKEVMVKQQLGEFSDSERLKTFWKDAQKTKTLMAKKPLSEKEIAHFSTEKVRLSAGTILKRVSTVKEDTIKPEGFYAAYKKEDVNRYKAVLPVYWKLWGIDDGNGGHVVNLRAKKSIVAPSEKETFEHFVNFLGTNMKFDSLGNKKVRALFDSRVEAGLSPKESDRDLAKKVYRQFAGNWNDSDNPGTRHFFDYLEGKGYNAIVDHNDAGSLADSPLRVFNGGMFEVAGHERLTVNKIRAAQQALVDIAHSLMVSAKEFIAHKLDGRLSNAFEYGNSYLLR